MSLTSDELNLLIYRYLRESGFDHTAFTFANESTINKSTIDTTTLPAAALISYVQKGMVVWCAYINTDTVQIQLTQSILYCMSYV